MSARPYAAGAAGLAILAFAASAAGHRLPPREPTVVAPSAVQVVGDAIPAPLTTDPGDAARGRALLVARDVANCVLCHAVPDPAMPFAGNLGPSLAGVASRFDAGQLRLRIVDSQRILPDTIMPSYYRTEDLHRVARQYRGQPVLTAQEVEDIVQYLRSLR